MNNNCESTASMLHVDPLFTRGENHRTLVVFDPTFSLEEMFGSQRARLVVQSSVG
eukprot:m.169120 g.169120  ORF g.169120 m.169120 type:complete len:55 (-) comp18229_c0_seq1:1309-1473(-)